MGGERRAREHAQGAAARAMTTPRPTNITSPDSAVRASEAQDNDKQKDRKSRTAIRAIMLGIWCRFSTIMTLPCRQAC